MSTIAVVLIALRPRGNMRAFLLLERRCWLALVFSVACPLLLQAPAAAYTAAGDRVFPATILLPQPAPTDALYTTPSYAPVSGGNVTNVTATLDKMITERLGVGIVEGYNWVGQNAGSTLVGWQNLLAYVKYEAISDPPHEFLFSLGTAHEFGDTGTRRIGASQKGATLVPTVFFAKGLGDSPIDYLRPVALQGFTTYQLSDGPPRLDNYLAGLAIEYSIPYLQSKVKALDLPDFIRGLTPLVEALVSTPTRDRGIVLPLALRPAVVVGPGITYSGQG